MSSENTDTANQANQVPYYWVSFADDSQTVVVSITSGPTPQHENAVKLPANDQRVLALTQPPEKYRVAKLRLRTLEQLNRLANLFDTVNPKPVYRGQRDFNWKLETRLESNAPAYVKKESGLEIFEYQTLIEAKRRLHHYLDKLPDDNDLLSWLALLRHHGVPTRLLDVTKSIFIACYFAMRDARPGQDAALWVFQRNPIDLAFTDWSYSHRETIFRESPFTVAQYGEYYGPFPKSVSRPKQIITYNSLRESPDGPWLNFESVLEAAMLGFIEKPGVGIAEPYWLSKRTDVQQGAFLIPFNVRYSFEENLYSYLLLDETQDLNSVADEIELPDDEAYLRNISFKSPIIKVRLCSDLHDLLRRRLNGMNLRDLTLFPDVEGAMQHISSYVPKDKK